MEQDAPPRPEALERQGVPRRGGLGAAAGQEPEGRRRRFALAAGAEVVAGRGQRDDRPEAQGRADGAWSSDRRAEGRPQGAPRREARALKIGVARTTHTPRRTNESHYICVQGRGQGLSRLGNLLAACKTLGRASGVHGLWARIRSATPAGQPRPHRFKQKFRSSSHGGARR